MTRILILYGTTDGHTAKVAAELGRSLVLAGCRAEVVEAGKDGANPDPQDYQGVVVAASVHAGGFQRAVLRWVPPHLAELRTRPNAFLPVCLAVLQKEPEVRAELEAIVRRFSRNTGWNPNLVKYVAGAMPFTRYGFFKRLLMRYMARKAGVVADPRRDYEYTDWADLRAFGLRFAAMVESAGQPTVRPEPAAVPAVEESAPAAR